MNKYKLQSVGEIINLFKRGAAIIFVLLAIFTMPAMAANATSFLNVTATEQSVAAGTNITYVLNLTNNGTDGTDSYFVNITNTDSASTAAINISSPVAIAQAATQFIALNVTNTVSGTFKVNVTATSVNDSTKSASINTTTTVTAVRAVNLTNVSATTSAPLAGTNNTYTLILTNNGTDPDTYNLTVTNGDSASTASVNVSSISLAASASQQFTLNVTNTVAGVFKVNVTATSVNDTSKAGYVNTTTSVYDLPGITGYAPSSSVTDIDAVITRAFNITVNQSVTTITWYINGTQVQQNTSVSSASYTNTSATLGVWNVTAIASNSAGSASQTWTWNVPTSTISSLVLSSNSSTNDRVAMGTNTTMNFTFSDTGNVTHINITFPATYNFSGVVAANITTSMGTCTVIQTSTLLSCYNATPQNNTNHYINITGQLKTSPVSATNTITVTTNKNATGAAITQYTRDITKPFYVSMNNSVFTVASESFGTNSETITLTGSGSANLTFYTQNITGQTNITVGFGASNVTVIRSRYNGTINGMSNMNTIYIETNPTVTNPVIVISAEGEFESSNLPLAITAAGSIAGLTVIYAYLRRRRRH